MRAQFQLVAILAAAVAFAVTLFFLLLAPQARTMETYTPSPQLRLADGSILKAQVEKRNGNDDLPLANGHSYSFSEATGPVQEGVKMELFVLESANADALQLPRKFGPRALFTGDKDLPLTIRHDDSSGGSWLEGRSDGRSYFAARISSDGSYRITRRELWRGRLRAWARHPAHLLRWLFTSEEIVDRRGLWLQLWSSSPSTNEKEIEELWQESLHIFSATAPAIFATAAKERVRLVRRPEAGAEQ